MILSLLGILLLLLPFLVVFGSENKTRTFTYVFAGSATLYLFVALVTQLFHIFSYGVILSLHIILVGLWLWYAHKQKWIGKYIAVKPDQYLIVLCLFAAAFLFSLHYNYAGVVDSVSGLRYVKSSSYVYPFYSDEWVAVSLVNFSIEKHSLPLVNPLFENSPFPNFLFVFHSFLAYLFLVLNISVLTHYVLFAIIITVLILAFSYWLLRLLNVSQFSAFISTLTLLFITNSGNLPGLWNLLPYNVSLVFLLLSIICILSRWYLPFGFSLFLTLLFYPPMIVFVVPLIAAISIMHKNWNRRKIEIALGILMTLCIIGAFLIKYFDLLPLIIRKSLDSGIVYYEPWNVIPIFILPFICIGLWNIWKSKVYVLLLPIITGAFLWMIYIFLPFVFVMEQSRIVSITSILLVIISSFAIDTVFRYLNEKHRDIFDTGTIKSVKFVIIAFLVLFAVFHTRFGLWHKLVLIINDRGTTRELVPSPPVTRYLTSDDSELFKDIKGKRFISPSWKGLVIGAATGNYPLDSKSSTITNKILRYDDFIGADCEQKLKYAMQFKIEFVYTKPFSCDSFIEVGKSSEGFVLHRASL